MEIKDIEIFRHFEQSQFLLVETGDPLVNIIVSRFPWVSYKSDVLETPTILVELDLSLELITAILASQILWDKVLKILSGPLV